MLRIFTFMTMRNIGMEFYFLMFLPDFNIQVIQVLQYNLVLFWKFCKRFIFFFSAEFKIVDQWSHLEVNLYVCVPLCMSVCVCLIKSVRFSLSFLVHYGKLHFLKYLPFHLRCQNYWHRVINNLIILIYIGL